MRDEPITVVGHRRVGGRIHRGGLGLAFGRVGCFLNGCCFGGVCELPWAVQFPAGSPPYIRQAERGQLYGIQVSAQVDAASSGAQAVISSVAPNSVARHSTTTPRSRFRPVTLPAETLDGASPLAPSSQSD